MAFKIGQKHKFLLTGDSITDCGRPRPVGEGSGQLGNGYVAYVDALIGGTYPDRLVRVLNTGVSGSQARDLKLRWQADVLDHRPDWLSVMIGTNDVWRQFDSPKRPEWAVLPDEYESTLDGLLAQTRPDLRGGLVLMTPFYIEPNKAEPMRKRMDEYGAIVKKLAARHDAVFVDTQAAFDAALSTGIYAGCFAGDRVHPNAHGHMILARALLKALDFQF
jgi:lysophospholipase L1-like esterase